MTSKKMEVINESNKVSRVQIEPERVGWTRLADLVRQKDRVRIDDVKEDIDTLLVLAGLFSAVISAFIIESYKNLQQQPEDMTVQVLSQISIQLAALTLNGNFINSTVPTSPPFTPPRFATQVNTLWFLSLIISLITASFGILVKQWFHEYMARDTHDPAAQVKVRLFRDAGMQKWRVFEIAAFLPLLLQLALLLFFTGLGLFLHDINHVIGWITTALMLLWSGMLLSMTALPAFSSQCPYKTPMLKDVLNRVRTGWIPLPFRIATAVWLRTPIEWTAVDTYFAGLRDSAQSWRVKLYALEEGSMCQEPSLDTPALICLKDIFQGERLDETILHCVQDRSCSELLEDFHQCVAKPNPMERGLLPHIPAYMDTARDHFFGLLGNAQSLIASVGEDCDPPVFGSLHLNLSISLSDSHIHDENMPVPRIGVPVFVQLIQAGPTSASFSILTMYSIRHRTIVDYPNTWREIFRHLSNDEKRSSSADDRFVSNLVAATQALIRSLWDQQPEESGHAKINECIAAIRATAIESDPVALPDPIAFISTFTAVLCLLAPKDVIQRRKDDIFETMKQLTGIVTDPDVSSWSKSRKCTLERTCALLHNANLVDGHLLPNLVSMAGGWTDHDFYFDNLFPGNRLPHTVD